MANWTNIPTDRIEPGKPIRAIDGLALRDNPIAIAEGASGAPKIREAAISTNSINGNRLRTNSVPNDRLTNNSITGAKLNDGSIRSWIGSQSAGAVGTYALVIPRAVPASAGLPLSYSWGQTVAGSNLRRSNANGDGNTETSGNLSGTWRVVSSVIRGRIGDTSGGIASGLALRIS